MAEQAAQMARLTAELTAAKHTAGEVNVFKAHRLLNHSTVGLRVMKKKKKETERWGGKRPHGRAHRRETNRRGGNPKP